jgi:hypothetical protein
MSENDLMPAARFACALLLTTVAVAIGCSGQSMPPAAPHPSPEAPAAAVDDEAAAPHTDHETPAAPSLKASARAETSTPEIPRADTEPEQATPQTASQLAAAPSSADAASSPPKAASTAAPTVEPKGDTPLRSAAATELFAGWPAPDMVLLVSGEQLGYLEPCGCAGLENQKGGLSRRHSLVKTLAERGWPVAPIDLGNQVRRFGPQQEIKFHTTIEGLKTIGYKAIGFGPDDLRLPVGELLADVANEENGFVAANVAIKGFEEIVPRFRLIELGGRKVAVTAILGERAWQKVNNDELSYTPAAEALVKVVETMSQQADTLVLLSHATPDESKDLAKQFPQFRIVVTAGGADEPPAEPTVLEESGTRLVEVGHKGMYVAAIGLYGKDQEPPLRYQRVALDKRFPPSPQMHNLMVAYQGQLIDRGFAGLGLQPIAHPSGRSFVGSQACADCHTKAHEVWSNTPHSHATETLVKLDPPRQFDPECVSCHVTGWDPQKFFPYASGFESLKKTPLLKANGCENCHGPGNVHVAIELGEMQVADRQRDEARKQMRLPYEQAEKNCRTCHDHDNSPEFNFETYWPKVEHRGKD